MREELLELAVELRRQRLVVRQHQRRALHVLDDVGDREGLARAGDAEQRLVRQARLEAVDELRDRLRLIARRLVVALQLEAECRCGRVGHAVRIGRSLRLRRRQPRIDSPAGHGRQSICEANRLESRRHIPLVEVAVSLPVSKRVQRVKPSPTVALTGRVAQLKAEGKDIIGLGAGEPDFDTPTHIAEAGIEAIRKGFTRYTAVEGTAELKDAIIAKFKRENGLEYKRSQILVSTGAKQTIFNLILALIDPGDEVVIPAPYWVSYPDMVMLADGVPVTPYAGAGAGLQDHAGAARSGDHAEDAPVHSQQPEQPDRRRVHARGAARARRSAHAVIRTSSSARTTCTSTSTGRASRSSVSLSVCPELYDRTVTTNGVSKAYAMTGWRIGYCGGPTELITAMATIQGQSTSNPSSHRAEGGGRRAERAIRRRVREMNRHFKQRHDFIVDGSQQAARRFVPRGRRHVLCVRERRRRDEDRRRQG